MSEKPESKFFQSPNQLYDWANVMDPDVGPYPPPADNKRISISCRILREVAFSLRWAADQIRGHESFHRSVDEALNMGDGSYKP